MRIMRVTHYGLNYGLAVRSLRGHECSCSNIFIELLLPILGFTTEKLHFLSLKCGEQGAFACSRRSNDNENIFILQIHVVNIVKKELNGLIQDLYPLTHRKILPWILFQLFISLLCVPALAMKHRELLPIHNNILSKLQRLQHALRHLILLIAPFHKLGDYVCRIRHGLGWGRR